MMVGRELDHYFPPHAAAGDVGEPRLVASAGGRHRALHDIDLEVRRGEIVGIGGPRRAPVGPSWPRPSSASAPFDGGTVELDGTAGPDPLARQAIRPAHGLRHRGSQDRRAGAAAVGPGQQPAGAAQPRLRFFRRRRPGRSRSRTWPDARAARRRPDHEVRYLSGGNQQKVVLAKWLARERDILIFDEPTRGIDVGAKAGIHELMRELAQNGAAILMISSELPEVIGMSDRILVMRDGTIAGELPAGPTESAIMLLATGEQDVAGAA